MNLLFSFIMSRILNALEKEFLSHVPEMQQAFLNEVSALVKGVSNWIESKMVNQQEVTSNEEKNK